MKKLGVIVSLVFAVLLLASSFVSAQSISLSIADGAKSFYDNIFKPFGEFLLGANTVDGELFFAKLLFFIVLVTLVNYALSQFPPLKKRAWIISAIVSILAVRYITPSWIETIVLPYTALGITLTAFFPFILYFFFVEKGLVGYSAMRKIAWVFAAVVFVGLFIYRDIERFPASVGGFNPSVIYLITAGLSLIMLFADRTIQNAFAKVKASADSDLKLAKHQVDLDNDYIKVTKNQLEPGFDEDKVNIVIQDLRKKAKKLGIPPGKYTLVGKGK